MWLLVMTRNHGAIVISVRHRLWSDILWAGLSMVPRRETDLNESGDETNSPESVGTAKSKVLQLWWLVIKPSSPTSRISIFQSGGRRKKKKLGFRGSEWILGRDCCCCCEWSFGKMKPVIAVKLLVSLLRVEREDDATALFSSILGNLDGEGRQIDDYETAIDICPHWIHDVFTLKPNRNDKNSLTWTRRTICSPVIRLSEFLRLGNLDFLQMKVI